MPVTERKSAPPQLSFKEFKFKSEERIMKRPRIEEKEEKFVFKAKPVPKYP